MSYNQYDLVETSLALIGSIREMYIPLWWYSFSWMNCTATTAGANFIGKSATALYSLGQTQANLHTLSSNWSPSQKFAFECSMSANGTGYVSLWDMTTNTVVTQLSINVNIATVMRSGSITLIPGHTYGISLSVSSGTVYIDKASLVALLP